MKADLHLHTTLSDGRFTPAELVEAATLVGLGAIAVTDHDLTDGAAMARAVAEERGYSLEVIPGVEVSTVWADAELHVLGYFVDPACSEFQAAMEQAGSERERRIERFLEALEAYGAPVTIEAVRQEAGEGSLGRPHLARALIAAGHAHSEQQAFERYLTPGAPTYVPREGLTPFEAIRLIHVAGGVASLAHPRNVPLSGPVTPGADQSLIEALVAAGLDALEVAHPSNPPLLRDYYAGMVAHYGLGSSGGSDDHGPRPGRAARIGQETIPYEWVEALRARRPRRDGFAPLEGKLL